MVTCDKIESTMAGRHGVRGIKGIKGIVFMTRKQREMNTWTSVPHSRSPFRAAQGLVLGMLLSPFRGGRLTSVQVSLECPPRRAPGLVSYTVLVPSN